MPAKLKSWLKIPLLDGSLVRFRHNDDADAKRAVEIALDIIPKKDLVGLKRILVAGNSHFHFESLFSALLSVEADYEPQFRCITLYCRPLDEESDLRRARYIWLLFHEVKHHVQFFRDCISFKDYEREKKAYEAQAELYAAKLWRRLCKKRGVVCEPME